MGNMHIGKDFPGNKVWKNSNETVHVVIQYVENKRVFTMQGTFAAIYLQRCLRARGNSCLSVFLWVLFSFSIAILSVRGFIKL